MLVVDSGFRPKGSSDSGLRFRYIRSLLLGNGYIGRVQTLGTRNVLAHVLRSKARPGGKSSGHSTQREPPYPDLDHSCVARQTSLQGSGTDGPPSTLDSGSTGRQRWGSDPVQVSGRRLGEGAPSREEARVVTERSASSSQRTSSGLGTADGRPNPTFARLGRIYRKRTPSSGGQTLKS